MKKDKNKLASQSKPLIETMIEDKKSMRDYIKTHGTLKGFKSEHFRFAKPLRYL